MCVQSAGDFVRPLSHAPVSIFKSKIKWGIMNKQKSVFLGKKSVAAALAAVAAMVAVSAYAAAPKQAYVSHAAIGTNKSCASPGFNSVQDAIDAVAASGIVYLCGTAPFVEQVFLGKS